MSAFGDQWIEWLGLACGALLLGHAVTAGSARRSWIEAGAWGLLLLPLLLSCTVFVTLLAGGPLPGVLTTVTAVVVGALLLRILARRSARAAAAHPEPATTGELTQPTGEHAPADEQTNGPAQRLWLLLPLAALVVALSSAGDWGDPIPGGSWDSMAIWNTGARVLVRGSGDWPTLFRERVIGHPDYPLMLPGTLASVWSCVGGESASAPRSVALMFLLGLGLMTFASVRRLCGLRTAALATTLVLGTPILAELVRAQLADTALALLLLAAATALASRFARDPERRQPAWLAGLALGALPWCKNEGAVLAVVVGGAFVTCRLLGRAQRPAPRGELAALAGGAALPLAVLLSFKLAWAPDDPMFDDMGTTLITHLPDPARWARAWRGFAAQLNPWADGSAWGLETGHDRWGYAWPATALVALIGILRGRAFARDQRLFLGLVAAGTLSAYFAVYVTTPAKSQDWHIETSLFRLALQLFPTVLVWACAIAVPRWEMRADAPAEPADDRP